MFSRFVAQNKGNCVRIIFEQNDIDGLTIYYSRPENSVKMTLLFVVSFQFHPAFQRPLELPTKHRPLPVPRCGVGYGEPVDSLPLLGEGPGHLSLGGGGTESPDLLRAIGAVFHDRRPTNDANHPLLVARGILISTTHPKRKFLKPESFSGQKSFQNLVGWGWRGASDIPA